jgi:hypothetical protein
MSFFRSFRKSKSSPSHIDLRSKSSIRDSLAPFLSNQKQRLLVPHGIGRGTTSERMNRKRFAQGQIRRWLKKKGLLRTKRPLAGLTSNVLTSRFRANAISDAMVPARRTNWKQIARRDRVPETIEIKNFSFIDNPDETLQRLCQIIECEGRSLEAYVNFNDEQVMDIGPYLVLAEIWQGHAPVFAGGRMPIPVQRIIEAVRLRRALRMAPFPSVRAGTSSGVWALPVWRRPVAIGPTTVERALGPQSREKVTDDFCDWIDRCLGVFEINQELTGDGRAWLANMISELLDNAERHSSLENGEGNWSVTGFMARQKSITVTNVLSMAIVSVGRTISQSLETASQDITDRLNDYCQRHSMNGISREALRTVVALQDYVTRVKNASENSRGGIGFQEVIDFANEFGDNQTDEQKPRITVLSGDTCIQIGTPYMKGVRVLQPRQPRELWFNPENSPLHPPSTKHVYTLRNRFPGTLISIRLNLNPQALQGSVRA